MLKSLLLSNDKSKVKDIAEDIDAYYSNVYLPSDPLIRFQDDKGISDFLAGMYGVVLQLGRFISYKDARQDTLVELIQELYKIPPKTFRIWNAPCLVYKEESILATNNVKEDKSLWTERCTKWVNYSAFIARTMDAGIFERCEDFTKYPSWDLPEGIGTMFSTETERNCKAMVSRKLHLAMRAYAAQRLHCASKV
ncbi:hypothetical protein AJ80_07573 [Polytolypa hystricis UAMH7299]|uniref:Uncharacterized protein n=1 Tax=Polytolypa hystricis (strain UAMH7299) TaxID=1447883 RepID=A0A2B7XMT8_POLH7|nr:hypothetical protein AJ80_07573 [Polytolypa hystricis UAMH7299]